MADGFGSLVAVWYLAALIGGVVAATALVDLGAGPLRAWREGRRSDGGRGHDVPPEAAGG